MEIFSEFTKQTAEVNVFSFTIGDGGGPLVCQRADSCQWYLSGIVSSGKGCGEIGFPGIYTKVLLFENWIQNVLGDDFTDRCE